MDDGSVSIVRLFDRAGKQFPETFYKSYSIFAMSDSEENVDRKGGILWKWRDRDSYSLQR